MKTYDVLVICHEDGKDETIIDRKGDKAIIVNSDSCVKSPDGLMRNGALAFGGEYDVLCRMIVSTVARLYYDAIKPDKESK